MTGSSIRQIFTLRVKAVVDSKQPLQVPTPMQVSGKGALCGSLPLVSDHLFGGTSRFSCLQAPSTEAVHSFPRPDAQLTHVLL